MKRMNYAPTMLSTTVRNLSDKGISNPRIAALTGSSRQQVAGILAHYHHPESWNKGKGNKVIAKSYCGNDKPRKIGKLVGFAFLFD